jgi:hypothetical protein
MNHDKETSATRTRYSRAVESCLELAVRTLGYAERADVLNEEDLARAKEEFRRSCDEAGSTLGLTTLIVIGEMLALMTHAEQRRHNPGRSPSELFLFDGSKGIQ